MMLGVIASGTARDEFVAILGLRSLYFVLADMHARFSYLQQGLAIILAFVGSKMIISRWYHIATPISLLVIVLVLVASVSFSLQRTRGLDQIEMAEIAAKQTSSHRR